MAAKKPECGIGHNWIRNCHCTQRSITPAIIFTITVNCSNFGANTSISCISIFSEEDNKIFCWMKASKKTKSVSPRAAIKLQKDGFNLPSHDALAQILPDYLVTGEKAELQNTTQQAQENMNRTYKRASLPEFEDDPQMVKVTDLQIKEVENYRAAMSKMAEDIILLRTQIVALETENSQLRTDMSLHQDLGQDLLNDADTDVMTKAEMSDRITFLKFKLASETSKAAAQRDRIQQLQNELIKKNDSEKELIKLQRIHRQQEQHQRHQDDLAKMANMEATVKQQEKIIERLEKAMDNKVRDRNRPSEDKKRRGGSGPRKGETESALAAENAHLKQELDRILQQPPTVIMQQSTETAEVLPLKEKLSLLSKLEKAEARVQTLAAQLEENSKLWGRQKQDMLTKLSEQRHGFVHTTVPHNVSSVG